MTIARIAISVLIVAGLAGCGVRSDLDIVNNTDEPVYDVTISDGQTSWNVGDMGPNSITSFHGRLAGEGGPEISWTFRDGRYAEVGCYYLDSFVETPAEGAIKIEGEHLSFRCL